MCLGTISFNEFSAVLQKSSLASEVESGVAETIDMDVTDPTCIQSSSHSVMAGLSLFSLHIYVRAIHLDISPLTVPPGSVPARHFSLHRCTYLHTLKQLSGKCIVFIYKLYLQKCIMVLVNIYSNSHRSFTVDVTVCCC